MFYDYGNRENNPDSYYIMKHGRRDVNHVAAGELARVHGFTTLDLGDAGDGAPDWMWGKHGMNFIVEMKRDSKAKLRPKQVDMDRDWRGQWVRADSPAEAVAMAEAYVGAYKRITKRGQQISWNVRASRPSTA